MRLSNNLMYQSSVNKILEGQQGVANAQERVTTGKSIYRPLKARLLTHKQHYILIKFKQTSSILKILIS